MTKINFLLNSSLRILRACLKRSVLKIDQMIGSSIRTLPKKWSKTIERLSRSRTNIEWCRTNNIHSIKNSSSNNCYLQSWFFWWYSCDIYLNQCFQVLIIISLIYNIICNKLIRSKTFEIELLELIWTWDRKSTKNN